jgi:replicative DNA helicase
MLFEKPLPCNSEIEKYILGCLMTEKQCCDFIPSLSEVDFFDQQLKAYFNRAKDLYLKHEPVDLISLSNGDVTAMEYLMNVAGTIVTTESMGYHMGKLKELSLKRELIRRAGEIQEMLHTTGYDSLEDLKNDVLCKMDVDVYDSKKKDYTISGIIERSMLDIENRYKNENEEKLYTGFSQLDKITAGLHAPEMTIIAARPGIGKTAFVVQVLKKISSRDNNCVLFSREMGQGQIGERLIANESGIDSQKIRFAKGLTDDEWGKMARAIGPLSEMTLMINDDAVNVQEIRAFCRQLKNKGKLDLIAVDYLQLCKTLKKTQSREREVAEMSWEFKMMAKEFNVPVLVLSQLSREGTKAGKEPQLHDLRDSGAIEQDADNVIFLHVPDGTDETQETFDIAVIIAKQRQGPTGKIYLKYCKKNFRFWGRDY